MSDELVTTVISEEQDAAMMEKIESAKPATKASRYPWMEEVNAEQGS